MITLTQARTRTLLLADDVSGKRYNRDGSFTAVDAALKAAHQLVYLRAAKWAPDRFTVESSLTTSSSGVGTLTDLTPDPLRILSVAIYESNTRYPISPASVQAGHIEVSEVKTLKIKFIPIVTMPASGSDPFVWGQATAIGLDILDELLCLEAAVSLKTIEGELNKPLEMQRARTEMEARDMTSVSMVNSIQLGSTRRTSFGIRWLQTSATAIQLVR